MSSEEFKIKASKRRLKDQNAVRKQVRIAKAHGLTDKDIGEPHKLAKHHSMDCGTPGCVLCSNPRRNKTYNKKERLTIQERRFLQDKE